MKRTALVISALLSLASCDKPGKSGFEKMNGAYTATLYKWNMDNNQAVFYDTLYNQEGILEVKDDSDIVRFKDIVYTAHHSLKDSRLHDSLQASVMVGRTYYSITINKESKVIRSYESWAAPTGPSKGIAHGDYLKKN